jgi:uncharacterized membrane protein (UPF0127 family)
MTQRTPLPTAWLVSEGRVLASADVANTAAARRRGLIGRGFVDGAFVLTPCKWVHTIGMRLDLDVAYLDRDGAVIKTERLAPLRIATPVRHCVTVVEAAAGSFERWDMQVGDRVEVRYT